VCSSDLRIPLLVSTLLIVAIACILPFTVIGAIFSFVPPPVSFLTKVFFHSRR
jgi:hypothetical protein